MASVVLSRLAAVLLRLLVHPFSSRAIASLACEPYPPLNAGAVPAIARWPVRWPLWLPLLRAALSMRPPLGIEGPEVPRAGLSIPAIEAGLAIGVLMRRHGWSYDSRAGHDSRPSPGNPGTRPGAQCIFLS